MNVFILLTNREGYTLNGVQIIANSSVIEVKLSLPWKISSLIHYVIQSPWPLENQKKNDEPPKCRVAVLLEGDYDIGNHLG